MTAKDIQINGTHYKEMAIQPSDVFRYENGRLIRKKTEKEAGYISFYGYRITSFKNKRYPVHRLIWWLLKGNLPKGQIDHINQDRLDNRIENLRDVTNQINNKNSTLRITNKSGYTGISWDKITKSWRCSITVAGKCINLGRYKLLEDAIAVRKEANIHFGFSENHGKRKS